MSQSKEITRESGRGTARRSSLPETSRRESLSARLRILLDERARLVEQLALIDLDVDRVRAEAADGARRSGDHDAAPDGSEASFAVAAREFVRGTAEPPDVVDRDDYEACVGKVVLALRRGGEPLAGATLQVRYHLGTGCVTSIVLRRDDAPDAGREVYRRTAPALSAAG